VNSSFSLIRLGVLKFPAFKLTVIVSAFLFGFLCYRTSAATECVDLIPPESIVVKIRVLCGNVDPSKKPDRVNEFIDAMKPSIAPLSAEQRDALKHRIETFEDNLRDEMLFVWNLAIESTPLPASPQ
jgi:hypothetical protein